MENQKILDKFGEILIKEAFDPCLEQIEQLRNKEPLPLVFNEIGKILKGMDAKDFNTLKNYFSESLESLIFNFLRIFEEHQNYKINYSNGEKLIDLIESSEMLKAEIFRINGWRDRFSKFEGQSKNF